MYSKGLKFLIIKLGFGCLTPFLTIFQLYRGGNRHTHRKPLTCSKSIIQLDRSSSNLQVKKIRD
jgi:hypothetical protein